MKNNISDKTPINFIVTCYDKEEYLSGLIEVFNSYEKIIPIYVICYNGNIENFPCDIKIENNGHQMGDIDLTIAGYKHLIENDVNKFIKISIDSWLLDENKILSIFKNMKNQRSAYAGNYWFSENSESLSTDIFFADIKYGNLFESFEWDGNYFETSLLKP